MNINRYSETSENEEPNKLGNALPITEAAEKLKMKQFNLGDTQTIC